MRQKLLEILRDFKRDLSGQSDPELLKIKYLGRKSKLSLILRNLKELSLEERRRLGGLANQARRQIARQLSEFARETTGGSTISVEFDATLPGKALEIGTLHPITVVERAIRSVFNRMGFALQEGPEIETDYYNFEALNMPPGHPARDAHDTFYVRTLSDHHPRRKQTLLLRTHISPMQIRYMEKHQPPFAVIASGRVFRREATDARHEHTWDYMEGFMVGENISLANLKFTLDAVLKSFFGAEVTTQYRPSFFPFVEPGLEVAMSCIFCKGAGCQVCGNGWLEMLGAGMIHPSLFKVAGYPAGKYTGFAFGLGLSRFAMMKYNIQDIRLLYKNDLRYVKQ